MLRALYRVKPEDIERGFRTMMSAVQVEDAAAVTRALDLMVEGVDLADALHVVRSAQASSFATFDAKLAKRAQRLKVQPRVREP